MAALQICLTFSMVLLVLGSAFCFDGDSSLSSSAEAFCFFAAGADLYVCFLLSEAPFDFLEALCSMICNSASLHGQHGQQACMDGLQNTYITHIHPILSPTTQGGMLQTD